MLIGINWTSPQTLPIIKQLIHSKTADFCELLVDNFIHLPPAAVLNALGSTPVSFHIMTSRFLERSRSELVALAKHLRQWIEVLQPIYISDHLAKFMSADNRRLPFVMELDYEKEFASIKKQVSLWQDLLGQQILFENFASHLALGENAAVFFEKLIQETHAGLLFDISNAYIADINNVCSLSKWDNLIKKTKHFHVAGFRWLESPAIAIDTHDTSIAEEVLQWMENKLSCAETLVVELDTHIEFEFWQTEINKIKHRLKQYA